MKTVHDCWAMLETFNCQYGAHLFDGENASIYVNHWLDVDASLTNEFSRKNSEGFVGHCLFVFRGVKKFELKVTTYRLVDQQTLWNPPISFIYSGEAGGSTLLYNFEGSLQGFPSSVAISIEASTFELQILGADEPSIG
ncbi:MAG: hypothetical protein EWV63_09040 [Microcystis aeruginosa Ma_OC_H_19870700_S124]|uniref:Uncharacterized protein n=1 Tax=Microcystis aeruginosa Ma_OC_H_19870700_S124 TaxID=2486262 RepID=A0A552AP08_MICAE|nr:MAG: hypothetical protein EWV63_09040 [Microcystis aeruginosa Ma_OC_H_19870700_S124]